MVRAWCTNPNFPYLSAEYRKCFVFVSSSYRSVPVRVRLRGSDGPTQLSGTPEGIQSTKKERNHNGSDLYQRRTCPVRLPHDNNDKTTQRRHTHEDRCPPFPNDVSENETQTPRMEILFFFLAHILPFARQSPPHKISCSAS